MSTAQVRRPSARHSLNSEKLDASTKTPDTDEGVFGSGSLQLLSSILSRPDSQPLGSTTVDRRPAPSPGLIRRTLFSMLKLPQALVQPQESDSQMTNSVVLTKLDGGGSYHSAPIGDEDDLVGIQIPWCHSFLLR
jgi:hypothetical protein